MALLSISSPHTHQPLSTASVMKWVLIATLPGIASLSYFFGWGTITNIACAIVFALGFEALALRLRNRPICFYLGDFSAVVTAVLLAIALPPGSPFWLIAIGIGFAILIAKHLYGGLGYNPFNPAMIGYVVLLISFPVEMTQWAAPRGSFNGALPSFLETVTACWQSLPAVDAITMATPLDVVKNNHSLLLGDLYQQQPVFGLWAGRGWEWVNLSFLVGGLLLLSKRIFTWHAPIAMLASLTVLAALFYDGGSSGSKGSPLFHLFSGATMFAAFFIVTDPVTSAVSHRGKLIYGALIGVILFVIRGWGNYPDAAAFAVLLMNFAAPLIDHFTPPRSYGHAKTKARHEGP